MVYIITRDCALQSLVFLCYTVRGNKAREEKDNEKTMDLFSSCALPTEPVR